MVFKIRFSARAFRTSKLSTFDFLLDPQRIQSCPSVHPWLTFLVICSLLFYGTFQKVGRPYILKSDVFRVFRKIRISSRGLNWAEYHFFWSRSDYHSHMVLTSTYDAVLDPRLSPKGVLSIQSCSFVRSSALFSGSVHYFCK